MSKGHLSNDEPCWIKFFVKLSQLFDSRLGKEHGSVYLTQKRHPFPSTKTASGILELTTTVYTVTHQTSETSTATYPTPASSPNDLSDLQTPTEPLPILIRATNGKSSTKDRRKPGAAKAASSKSDKIKLSTIVQAEDLEAFFGKYGEACKAGMQALKKRDRSGRKKAGKKAKKRKGGGDGVAEVASKEKK
ncbi:MAG: RNA polymerase II holoenzyme cyclin-like subunit [Chaenotheca gracillima]|nr:MAG: RNA polymerase II holoenzyme cyclin-like subunit [Chaenotheca gracillima]